jgi:membrane protease YdiL (CAAX protease family)
MVLRELGMWLVAATILFIVVRCEKLPLRSIGLGTARWWKSILWGCLIVVASFPVAMLLLKLTGYTGGEAGDAFSRLPVWVLTLIVTRAGVVEELCYRGYAIERLSALGLPRWLAATIPLLIFGFAHWTGGWGNIIIALGLGGVLVLFYLWRRDLVANMTGHFLVDFIPNVLPKIFS